MLNHDQVACQYKQKATSRRSKSKTCLPLLTLTESFMIVLVPTRQYSVEEYHITYNQGLLEFIWTGEGAQAKHHTQAQLWLFYYSHCLSMLVQVFRQPKNTRAQFSVQEIHRNLKQNKKFNSRESFFRKSPFCTFFCINPGFGGPWDKL